MSAPASLEIKVTLPNQKELVFANGQALKNWAQAFLNQWRWLEDLPASHPTWQRIQAPLQNTQNQISNWQQNPRHEETVRNTANVVQSAINKIFAATKGVLWDDASLAAIDKAKKISQPLAAGLLTSLVEGEILIERTAPEAFFAGIIQGFLFKNEIDWTASAHHAAMQALENQTRECLAKQEDRLKQLEEANARLNEAHKETLNARDKALDELHAIKEKTLDDLHSLQDKAYVKLTADYEAKYQAIRKLYTDELALRAPVDYWEQSRKGHVKLAKRYAWASGVVFLVLGGALGGLIRWAFGSLKPDENPKHWEVGVVVVATFLVIWVIRLLIRLFLSHQHLATDAEQKVTMVKTFLALGKEEGGVAKEDRSVILQQLFKSAADGIVKEDGTPPGLLEYLSRTK